MVVSLTRHQEGKIQPIQSSFLIRGLSNSTQKLGSPCEGKALLSSLSKYYRLWHNGLHASCLRTLNGSPYSCRMATKVFISSMKPEQTRIYLHFVLLNVVRSDIAENAKLNVHYYEALIRAIYKPAAFFKGIVFPLLERLPIVASVLAKKTIPPVHLGAAIIHIAKFDFSGPRALFLRVLIDKKKELLYKVIDELVFHLSVSRIPANVMVVETSTSYPCFGIKASLFSASGTPRI